MVDVICGLSDSIVVFELSGRSIAVEVVMTNDDQFKRNTVYSVHVMLT